MIKDKNTPVCRAKDDPTPIAREAARAIKARAFNLDKQCGRGGYHVTAADLLKLKTISGDDTECALSAAGFFHDGVRFRTLSRAPSGAESFLRLDPPWELLRAIVAYFGDGEGEKKSASR